MTPLEWLLILSIGKLVVGSLLTLVLWESLQKFKKSILTIVTILTVANIFCIYILIEILFP
jgi:hypothetical protein